MDYTRKELMTVVLARDIKDGEIGLAGAIGGIPLAASLLAQKLHAPNSVILGGVLNPKIHQIYPGGNDHRNFQKAEAYTTFYDVFELAEKGLDFFFYSGLQIDQYGNVNLTYVGGSWERPLLRGPGLANSSFAVSFKRFYLWAEMHTKRNFVERVDFISAAGFLEGGDSRLKAGIITEGPRFCVTPLAVMDFEEKSKRMRLKSIHEGVSVEEVIENTGFSLIIPSHVPITLPPSDEEIRVLREEVDTAGLLRR